MSTHFLLYVEDDPSNRLVMRLLIEKTLNTKNYAIFENSQHFMVRLRNLHMRPSLIMLDIHVAPLNGFQLLQLIREDSTYLDTKVIALTASVMNEEVTKLRESGFDGAIGKPIALSSFPSTIERILQGETVWLV
jgi:polar amino acid transport system substrate-binding protein/two-component system sensor histidine kinase EvgS